jgi:hypothetical protein
MSRHGFATCVFVLGLLCGVSSVAGNDPINVFEARLALNTEQMQIFARRELGCDPCSEVVARDSGGEPARYFVSADPVLSIRREDIRSAVVQGGRISETNVSDFLLMIELSDSAQASLTSVTRVPVEYGANYYRGEFVGLGPLAAFGSYYVIGSYESRDEATKVSTLLGVEPSFVQHDERSQERLEERLRDEGGLNMNRDVLEN